jgi:predicted transposase YbfD/YdcC
LSAGESCQEKVASKSKEITAIPLLLKLLALNDRIITIDAMGSQRAICEQIIAQGGDYLIALKGKQGMLHKDVTACFANKTTLKNSLISAADIAWQQQEQMSRIKQYWYGCNDCSELATIKACRRCKLEQYKSAALAISCRFP